MTKFMVITDLHYSSKEATNDRRHSLSADKTKKAIAEHSADCGFIMNLGDTADAKEGYENQLVLLREISGIFDSADIPVHSIIGNHDTASHKRDCCEILRMPSRYYTFDAGEYLGVVLDGAMNDINQPYPESEMIWQQPYIDTEQLEWFSDVLEKTDKKVLLFTHFPFFVTDADVDHGSPRNHCILNRDEVMKITEKSGKVAAVLSGHLHTGDFIVKNSVPHITFRSMVVEDNISHAVVTVDGNRLTVEGFGLQESYSVETAKT